MARQRTAPSRPIYSGAWRATSTYADIALPLAPGADPSHLFPDEPDPGQVAAGYPRVDLPPTYITQDTDTSYEAALDTPGLILDMEPVTHDAGDPDAIQPSPGYGGVAFAPQSRAHGLDRGRAMVGQHEEPMMRASDERPLTERWEQAPTSAGSTTAALRAANSLPQNNPEGFPTGPGQFGMLVKRFYHRNIPTEHFVHTERWLHPVTAGRAAASPAMTPEQSNRYTSPFAWRSFYGTELLQGPLMRRQPPDVQSQATDDGTEDTSDIPGDWTL